MTVMKFVRDGEAGPVAAMVRVLPVFLVSFSACRRWARARRYFVMTVRSCPATHGGG